MFKSRYEMQWYSIQDNGWRCKSRHTNKRDALRLMSFVHRLNARKFALRLIDRLAKPGAPIKELSRVG